MASVFELFVDSDYTVPWSLLFWLNMLSTLLKTKTCLYKRHIHEFEVVFCFFLKIPISLKINGKKLFLSISQVLGKKLDGFSDLYCGARLEFRLCFLLWQQFDKCPKLLVKAAFFFEGFFFHSWSNRKSWMVSSSYQSRHFTVNLFFLLLFCFPFAILSVVFFDKYS